MRVVLIPAYMFLYSLNGCIYGTPFSDARRARKKYLKEKKLKDEQSLGTEEQEPEK